MAQLEAIQRVFPLQLIQRSTILQLLVCPQVLVNQSARCHQVSALAVQDLQKGLRQDQCLTLLLEMGRLELLKMSELAKLFCRDLVPATAEVPQGSRDQAIEAAAPLAVAEGEPVLLALVLVEATEVQEDLMVVLQDGLEEVLETPAMPF